MHVILAGAAGLNLLLGAAAAAGVMPRAVHTESAASIVPAPVTLNLGPASPAPSEAVSDATTVPPETVPPPTLPPTTSPPRAATVAAAEPDAAPADDAPAVAAAFSSASSAPTVVPRVNPSSAQVQAAIAQLRQRILLFSPTEAQARQFGDQVCTAFDQGQTYAQVKATGMQMVSQVPLITVSSADADFAIRTAVQLFCPGYQSRLP
jgi:hypothetical protein